MLALYLDFIVKIKKVAESQGVKIRRQRFEINKLMI